ncbi:MAG: EAL domain-containing protein [Anaerolineales bacterium]
MHLNEQAATIVRAVLELGRGLKLPILAEGVEEAEELDFLRDAVCDSAQGYWFGMPRDISHYRDIVDGRETHIEPEVPTKFKASA